MKKVFYCVPALLCMTLAMPMQGNRTYNQRDVVVADTVVTDDSMDVEYTEDDDWAGTNEDVVAADSAAADDSDIFCPYNDELLSEYSNKNADYSLQNSKDANQGLSFNASLFFSDADAKVEPKKGGAYSLMIYNILKGTLDLDATNESSWKLNTLEKMLEAKWSAVKATYQKEQNEIEDFCKNNGQEYMPTSFSYRTNVTPVWRWSNKGITTYSIEDECYRGGAHGMLYHYYFSINTKEDRLMGLTDIFKPEALNEVFKLVGEKLKTSAQAAQDQETWPAIAEVVPAPSADDYSVRTQQMEQYQGKWYPRPAVTECGIVFTYPPYIKNCYAAGTINIVLSNEEVKNWLK